MDNHTASGYRQKITQHGFTFVELCIVMVIVGVMVAAVMQGLTIYYQKIVFDKTKDNIAAIESDLRKFVAENGSYPCPAPLNAASETAGFGQANCPGAIEVDGEGGLKVRIGAVPTRALGITDNIGFDGWGQKLVYAVTEQLTVAPLGIKEGAISVLDKGDNEITNPARRGHYVLFSPGPDAKGAYTSAGVLVEDCADNTMDRQNCDFEDATFRYSEERSLTGNNFNYDDVVAYRSTLASSNEADCGPGQVVVDFDNGEATCGDLPQLTVPACPAGQYLAGFTNAVPDCRALPDCVAGQYLAGITAGGGPDCQPLPNPPSNCNAGTVLSGGTCIPLPGAVPAETATACPVYQDKVWDGTKWACIDPPAGTIAGYGSTLPGSCSTNNVPVNGFFYGGMPGTQVSASEPAYTTGSFLRCRPGWLLTCLQETNTNPAAAAGGTGTLAIKASWVCQKT